MCHICLTISCNLFSNEIDDFSTISLLKVPYNIIRDVLRSDTPEWEIWETLLFHMGNVSTSTWLVSRTDGSLITFAEICANIPCTSYVSNCSCVWKLCLDWRVPAYVADSLDKISLSMIVWKCLAFIIITSAINTNDDFESSKATKLHLAKRIFCIVCDTLHYFLIISK